MSSRIARVRLGEQVLDELQAGGIGPLQVVEEQRQRMIRAGEHRQELLEHQAEAVLRLDRRQRRHRRLRADDERDLRQHVDDQLAVDADGGLDLLPPAGDALLALGQQLLHQVAQRLREGGVRNVALVLVELAGNEVAAPCDDRLLQFTDQRGLADPRVARDGDQRRLAGCRHALEGRQQRRPFLRRAHRACAGSGSGLRSRPPPAETARCARMACHCARHRVEIGVQPAHALIAVLRQLGQQLHHDVRDRLRHVGRDVARRRRDAGDMAMRPFQRIVRGKRQLAGQHAVQRDAERIEIGAVIDRAMHAPGLFGRQIGPVGRACGVSIGRKSLVLASGEADIGQQDAMALARHQQVGGADIPMDDPGRMHAGQGLRELAGDVHANGPRHAWMLCQKEFERFACEVVQRVQHHRQMPALIDQGGRFDDAGNIKRLEQRVFVSEMGGKDGVDIGRIEALEHGRLAAVQMSGTIQSSVRCRAEVFQ